MKKFTTNIPIVIVASVLFILFHHPSPSEYPEIGMTIQQLIEYRGFQSETHFINSQGYILQTVRIINPLNWKDGKLKPLLLYHGYQASGTVWLVASNGTLKSDGTYWEEELHRDNPKAIGNSLALVLATRGYDVWIANARGTIYSTNHTSIDVEDEEFWKFSMDDVIEHDMPTVIEYIRNKTNSETIGYIGHSQGNFKMFGLLSMKPEYSNVIKPFIALSPIVYFSKCNAPAVHLVYHTELVLKLNSKNFLTNLFRNMYLPQICVNPLLKNTVCYVIYHYFLSTSPSQMNFKRLPVYLDNILHGSSTRSFVHFLQHRTSMVHYDHGDPAVNYAKYNQTSPPLYDFGAINSSDIAAFYLKKDAFLHVDDVESFKKLLKVKLAHEHIISDESFGHMDLIWGHDVGLHVNQKIVEILDQY